jgi:hypothetical protein
MSDKTTISDTYTHYEYADGKSTDGIYVGQSGSKVGFFGTTPAIQQTAPTAVTTTYSTAVTTHALCAAAINDIITKLTTLGLWA